MTEEPYRPNWKVFTLGLFLALLQAALVVFVFHSILYLIRHV